MKHSNKLLFTVLIALGLSACDSGDPTIEDAPESIEVSA